MWIFNVFLYLCFLFNQDAYRQLLEQGATCFAYMPDWGNEDPNSPPACFYLASPSE